MRLRSVRGSSALLAAAMISLTMPHVAHAAAGSRSLPNATSIETTTDVVADVAAALRQDPVFVDPAAERALSEEEASTLRSAVEGAGTPIFVAVLPSAALDAAAGDATQLTEMVADATGLDGTYAVLAGDSFRAGSSELRSGEAGRLATAAFDAHSDEGPTAVLMDFVRKTADAAQSSSSGSTDATASGAASSNESDSDSGGVGVGTVLLVGGAAGVGFWGWRRFKRSKAEALARAEAEQADRQMLHAELSVLADDILRVENDVLMHPDAQSDYDSAVNRFKAASAALEQSGQAVDLVRVQRVVDEARYAMDRTKATIAGRTLPEPPDELRRAGRHGEPAIDLDDQRQPVYVGYGGQFQNGWFGLGGGLFSGLLLGSMLGGFGGFGGFGGTTVINEGDTNYGDGSGDGDWGGGGDFGGDWGGGGDFGGGDFGGGGDF